MPGDNRMPQPTLLLTSFSVFLLKYLNELMPPRSVLILEEPDVLERRRVFAQVAAHPCIADVIGAPIQQPTFSNVSDLPVLPPSIRSVIPGTEYGVAAAATLASRLGLPGIGAAAAPVFRDKRLLRQRLAGQVSQPRWAPVTSPEMAHDFARSAAPRGVVIKPSGRHASLGVTLCDGPADVTAALELLGHINEVMRSPHATPDGPMIEERLTGAEVSVEALVADGEMRFVNVTDKDVFPGPHPVEAGHTIPSRQPENVRAELASAMQRLVAATGARTTALHAEWIVDQAGTPWLVECAARVPGDGICDLISLSHSCSFVEAYLQLMRGQTPAPMTRTSAAAIRFLTAEPGVINEIAGVPAARQLSGVLDAEASAAVGEVAGDIGSSYSRLGHVMVTGKSRAEAVAAADRARETIHIVTKPAMLQESHR